MSDQRKQCAIWTSSVAFVVLLCLTLCSGWQRLAGAVGPHGAAERWAAFAVGFLLTAAILLVIF
jgi:hypothetical protein